MKFIRDKFNKFREEQIQKFAYSKYLKRNCSHGHDKEDWSEASKKWFSNWILEKCRGNIELRILFLTMVILGFQIFVESENFVSLNRPFVEIEINGVFPNSEGKGEDPSQIWCELSYRIHNFGPVPAYNIRIPKNGLRIRSKNRSEFTANAIPRLNEWRIGWLAPNDNRKFYRNMIFTDSKSNVDAYREGKMPLEITFRVSYDGPQGMIFRRRYWYECEAQYLRNDIHIINVMEGRRLVFNNDVGK